jgi:hypothetical protein
MCYVRSISRHILKRIYDVLRTIKLVMEVERLAHSTRAPGVDAVFAALVSGKVVKAYQQRVDWVAAGPTLRVSEASLPGLAWGLSLAGGIYSFSRGSRMWVGARGAV